ncbi:MAG: hypothetical protein E6J89_19290 [Deltaproteobacteria bacterium]|nr:MAG: hypothetical protein E6J89_19290 [Deltaproteobacteria bacterium]
MITKFILVGAMTSLLILHLAFLLASEPVPVHQLEEIPFLPTPMEVVDRMLEIAEVKQDDDFHRSG